MKLPFIYAIVLALVFSPVGSGVAAAQEEPAEGEVLDEGKHKITFDPFQITMMRRGVLKGIADIQLVLQLHDNKEYESLNALKPQLTADIAAALSTLSKVHWSVNRPIDPDTVSKYLTPIVARRVGGGKLDVYVLHALINPK